MAMLAFPLATSILKPHTYRVSFFCVSRRNTSRFCKSRSRKSHHHYHFTISAITTSAVPQHSSTDPNAESKKTSIPTFQQAIQRLQEYWASVGCAIMQCSNTEVGAGTMNPLTFLRVLGPEPWNVALKEWKSLFDVARETGVLDAVVMREVKEKVADMPSEIIKLLFDFFNVAPEELPNELPLMRNIQHGIDFVPWSQLPNLPAYRMNLSEHVEL